MPSQSPPDPVQRVCVFGDSHIGAVKRALDGGLIDTTGRSISFFGADGPSFRALRWRQGRVVPDAPVRELVRRISGGAESLGPGDHDLFIFYGARLRAHEFFKAVFDHEARPEGHLTEAQLATMLKGWAESTRAWRIARGFAGAGAQVVFVPTAFPTEGILDKASEKARLSVASTRPMRARLWQLLQEEARRGGVLLVPQPEETVTGATLTRKAYAAPGAEQSRDWVHKSPEYAAMMLDRAFGLAGRQAAATGASGAGGAATLAAAG